MCLTFHGTQDTIAGERKLLDAGVDTRLIPAPKAISPGCGICLTISPGDIGKARLLLGKSIRSIYAENGTGFALWEQ